MKILLYVFLPLLITSFLCPQSDTTMYFEDYDPPSSLVVPQHPLRSAKYPFIDVHNHQWNMSKENLADVINDMDKLNMAVMVNLSGRGFTKVETEPGKFKYRMKDSQFLKESIRNVSEQNPGKFIIFTNIDFYGFGEEGWIERTLKELEDDVKSGANGLKIYKNLGLTLKDNNGNRVPTDDSRLDSIWQKCAELGIPVLIHTGEPFQFWQPKDKNNERWLELKQKPNRYRDPKEYPPWEQIMEEQHNAFRKNKNTIFINAHLGWLGNDLARLGKLMDEIPNMYTEIGAVLAELGRQPRFAREWFIKYQDRIMFGKDSWNPEEYYVYFRVLETEDEYFDYYRKRHAFWKMYGLGLPDEVLKKLYYKNALKIIPGIDKTLFPD
ncbi:amidohydrolase family protein [Candidatus Woesearchaeota archaeon]|nr:amidohydrolase family protein [Candidatus Woesearchaeota archaeon]